MQIAYKVHKPAQIDVTTEVSDEGTFAQYIYLLLTDRKALGVICNRRENVPVCFVLAIMEGTSSRRRVIQWRDVMLELQSACLTAGLSISGHAPVVRTKDLRIECDLPLDMNWFLSHDV